MPTTEEFAVFGVKRLLPLCRDRFADAVHGGFHERLDAEGVPLPLGTKRLMVQCRQIYVLSHAALLGDPSGAEAAASGYRFLRRVYHDRQSGGWHFQASAAGEVGRRPDDRAKDLYGHAFLLFMLAYGHRAFALPDALALAAETMDVLHARLAAPLGGFWDRATEDWQPDRSVRRQNPHMHLLEAMLALYEASGDARWLTEADALVALFRERFFAADCGMLGEFFTADWSPDPTTGHLVEPGHHFEWVWLLYRHAALAGRPVEPAAERLFETAMRHGFDAEHGGIVDQHDRAGAPVARTRRIWTVAEAIKAQVARIEAGLAVPPDHPGALIDHLFEWFLRPAGLGWIETMEADGTPRMIHLPGSTPYHLFLSSAEVARVRPNR